MTKIAADLRARAVNGEDPDKLANRGLHRSRNSANHSRHEDGEGAPRRTASAT